MKITKKLRDVTREEYKKWKEANGCCHNLTINCKGDKCIFNRISCTSDNGKYCWFFNKDLYSDKFLDQTIEIEAPEILSKEEKEYLSAVIKPFRDRVTHIKKKAWTTPKRKYIEIEYRENEVIHALCFPDLPNDEMYKGMEDNRPYKLEELGL